MMLDVSKGNYLTHIMDKFDMLYGNWRYTYYFYNLLICIYVCGYSLILHISACAVDSRFWFQDVHFSCVYIHIHILYNSYRWSLCNFSQRHLLLCFGYCIFVLSWHVLLGEDANGQIHRISGSFAYLFSFLWVLHCISLSSQARTITEDCESWSQWYVVAASWSEADS